MERCIIFKERCIKVRRKGEDNSVSRRQEPESNLSLYPGSANYWLIDLTLQVISFSVSSFPFLGQFQD